MDIERVPPTLLVVMKLLY